MRILHLCLSNFYIDGFSYQENELVRQNILDGNDVEVIASTETLSDEGKLIYTVPKKYLGKDGAIVERVEYSRWLPHIIMKKLRVHPGIYNKIAQFNPDVILFHCACSWEINTAALYVKNHPSVKLYVDSHEDFVNSAKNFISKWVLHYLYYRLILRINLRYIEKVLPVSISCIEFNRDFYGVPENKIEFFPLGGMIPGDADYNRLREKTRAELNIAPEQILIVQSGKIDKTKKLVEALKAFSLVQNTNLRFVIPGLLNPEVESVINALIAADSRIRFIGWKSAEQLQSILCAADVYCQPGTQSATMQMSISCRCAVMLDDIPSHLPYIDGNGWLLRNEQDILKSFKILSSDRDALIEMSQKSQKLALRMLDYRLLAARLYR